MVASSGTACRTSFSGCVWRLSLGQTAIPEPSRHITSFCPCGLGEVDGGWVWTPLFFVQRACVRGWEQQHGWVGIPCHTRMTLTPLLSGVQLLRSLGPTLPMLAALSICKPMNRSWIPVDSGANTQHVWRKSVQWCASVYGTSHRRKEEPLCVCVCTHARVHAHAIKNWVFS